MLNRLTIKNVALIDYAEIEFGPNLNVLSGETGSGKSILLESINFALGAKADKSMIRHGESECSVSACFSIQENSAVIGELQDLGIDVDEDLIIFRRFKVDGRGDIKVNGVTVNASMLKKITTHLVDVHGQSEHFFLLNESNQLKVIDKFAGESVDKYKEEISDILSSLKDVKKQLTILGGDEKERDRRIDILKYQVDEIEEANLIDGEESELLSKRLIFNNIEKIGVGLSNAHMALSGENACIDALLTAKRALSDVSKFGEEYQTLSDRLENACLEIEDISDTVSSLADDLFFDENEAQTVEKRLDLIKSLKKKYGNSIQEILKYKEEISSELDMLLNSSEKVEKLEKEFSKLSEKLYKLCLKLTTARKNAANDFSTKIIEELKTLNIKNANFYAQFDDYSEEDLSKATINGLDNMKFMFSANAGEPLKPLSKVISGGEMSRLMLAIKTKSSSINDINTYIFDEIDAGISGNTAKVVAEKFAQISKNKQIIAVSHLAQISAMADENFVIYKSETSTNKTVTQIKHLSQEEKIQEIIRLVGGDKESVAAKSLADELIKYSIFYKK